MIELYTGVTSIQKFRECLRLLKLVINAQMDSTEGFLTISGLEPITAPAMDNRKQDLTRYKVIKFKVKCF